MFKVCTETSSKGFDSVDNVEWETLGDIRDYLEREFGTAFKNNVMMNVIIYDEFGGQTEFRTDLCDIDEAMDIIAENL